ncbi:MAG: DUF1028 domain-containing protein [Sporichthyaceae bacterium]
MTFSVVGRSADGASVGVAVASKFLAVGAAVPAAEAEVGAVATQSYANLSYRPDGLAMLRSGRSARDTLDALVAADEGRTQRQAGVVDRTGGAATYTGDGCHPWAGGRTGEGFAVQGNILVGPEVVEAMAAAWLGADGAPLPERLIVTLAAGDDAGGDRRGRQSAALLVARRGGGYGGESDVEVDLRVDDHTAPVAELRRLLDLHQLYFGTPDPATLLPLEGELAAEVAARLSSLGHPTLDDWAGVENFEERMVDGAIDPLVLEQLRATSEV